VPPPISVATPRPEPAPVPPPISVATPRPEPAPVPPPISLATPRSEPAPVSPASPTGEPRNLLDEEARALQPEPDPRHEVAVWVPSEPPTQEGGARVLWYAAGAALLAAIALGIYFPISSAHHSATLPQSIPAQAPQASAPAPAPAAVGIGFSAAPEGALWRLTWDRSAVDALHASSAVLSIRDGAKQQRVRLTLPDLTIGNVAYTPQSDNLVFSLKIAVPGGQVVEEQVRVLGALPKVETAKVSSESGSKAVEPVPVRTLRPFALTPNQPKDSSAGNRAVEVPPPPVLPSATNQPLSAVLPSTAVAPVQPSAGIAKPPSSPPANSVPARVDMARQLVGLWDATLSQSPFPTETATTSVNVYTGNVTGWFLGKYKIPRNGPPLKQPVSFQFQGNSEKDRLPDGAWLFTFRSADGWYGTIKLRPQGNTLDVMWKASLNDGKTYMFEHVMGHSAAQ
jgi:hypothetical protein